MLIRFFHSLSRALVLGLFALLPACGYAQTQAPVVVTTNLTFRVMAANINLTGGSPVIGIAQPLFPIYRFSSLNWPYDVSADGQRFLVTSAGNQANNQPITLVMNWDAELKKK